MSIIYDNINHEVILDTTESMRDILTTISSIDPTRANLTGDDGWINDVLIITVGSSEVLIDSTLTLSYKLTREEVRVVLIDGLHIKLDNSIYIINIYDGVVSVILDRDRTVVYMDGNYYTTSLDTDAVDVNLDLDLLTVNVQCGATLIPQEELMQKITGEDVGGFRVITTDINGYVIHATVTRVLAGKASIGITTHAVLSGDLCDIGVTGDEIIEETWNWDVNESIYLGIDGLLTQVVPTENFLQIVAVPLSPTSLRVRIEPPIFL